jgi:hypothetical protein
MDFKTDSYNWGLDTLKPHGPFWWEDLGEPSGDVLLTKKSIEKNSESQDY